VDGQRPRGRFTWKPRALKAEILPHDTVDFTKVMDALAGAGFVIHYGVDGIDYGCIPSWKRHQVINKREGKSRIPAPPNSTDVPAMHVPAPAKHVPGRAMHVPAPAEHRMEKEKEKESTTTTTESVTAPRAPRRPATPVGVVVDESARQGLQVPGESGAEATVIAQDKPKAVDYSKVSPKDWPKAEQERVARELAPLIWSSLDAQAQYETYRASGAANDITLVGRWLNHGFTPAEIKAALAQAGISTSTTVTNPLAFMGKVAPTLMDRMRRTGSYMEVRAAAPPAARPTPEGQAAPGFDDGDYIAKRNANERELALRHLPIWIKGGKRRWNSMQYGPAPGTGGSHITDKMVHEAEISLGVRCD